MFEHMRTRDTELFQQLGAVCHHLSQSTRTLEEMLAGRRGDEERLVHAMHERDREAHELTRQVDIRTFKAFVMRVDRMELHALSDAVDAVVDAVEKAGTHAAALHASSAPDPLRVLAARLTGATDALQVAVARVASAPQDAESLAADVRRADTEGDAAFETGMAELFTGAPDAVEVLRWKDVYEKVRHALGRCADAADALRQMTHQSTS